MLPVPELKLHQIRTCNSNLEHYDYFSLFQIIFGLPKTIN